jgi:hypothetical protein
MRGSVGHQKFLENTLLLVLHRENWLFTQNFTSLWSSTQSSLYIGKIPSWDLRVKKRTTVGLQLELVIKRIPGLDENHLSKKNRSCSPPSSKNIIYKDNLPSYLAKEIVQLDAP